VPAEVGRRAKALGLPVIALAGRVDEAARVIYGHGIDAFFSVAQRPCEEAEAMAEAEALIALEAENVMRAVMIGVTLGERTREGQAS
jgi:glycerate kinase